jgi:hypothetical protein
MKNFSKGVYPKSAARIMFAFTIPSHLLSPSPSHFHDRMTKNTLANIETILKYQGVISMADLVKKIAKSYPII